jgi:hypothetical protein
MNILCNFSASVGGVTTVLCRFFNLSIIIRAPALVKWKFTKQCMICFSV